MYAEPHAVGHLYSRLAEPRSDAVCRRDKSLSALAHELIAKYGKEGTEIDLDEVQVNQWLAASRLRTGAFPRPAPSRSTRQRPSPHRTPAQISFPPPPLRSPPFVEHMRMPIPFSSRLVHRILFPSCFVTRVRNKEPF